MGTVLRGGLRLLPMCGDAGSDALARRLWDVTETITGLRYDAPPARLAEAEGSDVDGGTLVA